MPRTASAGDDLPDAKLNIFNMQGQMVYSQVMVVATKFQVDLNHLPQGVYYAVLESRDSSETKMFLITK